MADKKSESKPDAPAEGAEAPKKGGGLKFALITVALLAVEAGVLFAVFSMGQPKGASAEIMHDAAKVEVKDERPLEVVAFDERASNDLSGALYQYDVDVYLAVKPSDHASFEKAVKESNGRIRAEILDIIRTAEPQHFREPLRETLRRRIESKMRSMLDKQVKRPEPGAEGFIEIESVTIIIGSGIRVSR